MNCDQVLSHLTELALREPMDAVRQTVCQAHLVACSNCRHRLAEIESPQRTLRQVAEADRRLEASPGVEQRLLAALRAESPDLKVRPGIAGWGSFPLWRLVAGLLLVAGLALSYLGYQSKLGWQIDTGTERTVVATSGTAVEGETTVETVPVVRQPRHTGHVARDSRSRPRVLADSKSRPVPVVTRDEAEEVLTDYLPLNPGQRLHPLERGQLIRVTVPRSTLGSFGFPVNPEMAMTPVKADLVVGEDGLARAIRFIK